MKIGIITFWDSQDNYGQVMQSYALSAYLTNAGHEAVVIRYKPYQKASRKEAISKLSPSHILNYYKFRKGQLALRTVVSVTRDFDGFRKKHIRYTDKIYHGFKQLWQEDWSSYDAFVCGSDQIWSPKPEEQLNAYFLQFAPYRSLRIAYAPSFGRSVLPAEYQKQLHGLLRHFDAVSVREKEGVDFCSNEGITCKLVCDPTLLLNDSDYRKLTNSTERDNHVFCYLIKWDTLFPVEQVKKVVGNFSGVHYFCTNGQEPYFDYEKNQTIENWLASIQKSNLSLTNSFHGTVFSILSHTPFVSFPLIGESSAMNNRLFSLLSKLGLESRIYKDGTDIQKIIDTPIDWEQVDERLRIFRQFSEDFIGEALTPKQRECEHNVCFLTNGSIHHNYGGLDRVTELLADYLKSKGANVYYVSKQRRKVMHEDMQYFLPDTENPHSEDNAKWLDEFMAHHNIDVLINQEGNVDITLPLKSSVRKITVLHFNPNYIDDRYFFNKIKTYPTFLKAVLTFLLHTPLNKLGLRYLRNKLSKNYEKQIGWADDFVLLSDRFKATLDMLLPNGYDGTKVIAINNPIVLDKPVALDSLDKEKVVLFVGRMDNNFKNVDKLLLMWKDIAKEMPDWKFVLCGDGPDLEYNKHIVVSNNIKNVYFAGQCDPTEYYKKSIIIIIMSSASEGWGMVLVEGKKYGCIPVVLNTYASVRDIVHDGIDGCVVEPSKNAYCDFAHKLQMLMRDGDKQKMMMKKSIDSVKQYDISIIGQQWLKLINTK